ncbi:MAG: inositol monophosphatase family protein, partial [Burkholderiaceae bacterium]|nr:inositol monophosphatase family protein [Burkholderiaceae bacterium]
MNAPLQLWLTQLLPLVASASDAVMAVYNTAFEVTQKADASPVTEADVMAEAIITEGLRSLTPDIPVIGEEATANGSQAVAADTFWLIDPVDGTREFLDRNGEFTVNIALVHQGEPCLGVVAAPALGEVFWGLNTPMERAAYWQAKPQANPQ